MFTFFYSPERLKLAVIPVPWKTWTMNPAENRPKIRKNKVENAIAKMKNSNAKTKRKIANQHLRLCLHLAELVVVMDLLVVLLKNLPEVVAEIRNEETRNLAGSELWEVEGPFSITQ